MMDIKRLVIPDVVLLSPQVFNDSRGCFFESFNQRQFDSALGIRVRFVQDNHSHSIRNVIRGLHYQIKQPQGKLVRVISGSIFDVAVDLRKSSPTFGHWVGEVLSAENKQQLWIPEGFAHGFSVLSEYAELLYKTTDYWAPEHEQCLLWDDPDLAIQWGLQDDPQLSGKDRQGLILEHAAVFE